MLYNLAWIIESKKSLCSLILTSVICWQFKCEIYSAILGIFSDINIYLDISSCFDQGTWSRDAAISHFGEFLLFCFDFPSN